MTVPQTRVKMAEHVWMVLTATRARVQQATLEITVKQVSFFFKF